MQNYHAHAGIELECAADESLVAPVVGTLAFVVADAVAIFEMAVKGGGSSDSDLNHAPMDFVPRHETHGLGNVVLSN